MTRLTAGTEVLTERKSFPRRNKTMNKKISDREIVEVLNTISDSAKKVLKNVRKKDMSPVAEAERLLDKLKSTYSDTVAAE